METDLVNHKGEPCLFKEILCQEGYCKDCYISYQVIQDLDKLMETDSKAGE